MKISKTMIIINLLAVIGYIIYGGSMMRVAQKEMADFDQTNVFGRLEYIGASRGRFYFRLQKGRRSKRFMFMLRSGSQAPSFNLVAEIGDSVAKPVYSDTLTLFKTNGEIFKYDFEKKTR